MAYRLVRMQWSGAEQMQKRCEDIEAAVRQAVLHCELASAARAALSRKIDGEIGELMEKRRATKLKNVPDK